MGSNNRLFDRFSPSLVNLLPNIYDSQKFNFLLKFAQVFYIGHLILDENRAFCQKQKSTDFMKTLSIYGNLYI
jgi:hypothetical protein